MMKRFSAITKISLAILASLSLLFVAGCAQNASPSNEHRAVVIVSGGDAVSPFTTPTEACKTGLAAGNTDTALRESLLAAGFQVYTAPAMNARSSVVEPTPDSFGAFGDCPDALPSYMTILSNADIDNAGEHLAHFAQYLNTTYGITQIDFVGHSNGGPFSRSAMRILQETGAAVQGASLTTVASPWMGAFPFQMVYNELSPSNCLGDARCESLLAGMREEVGGDLLLSREQLYGYMSKWNDAQTGVLDNVPVFMIGGGYLTNPEGDPKYWPFDGIVSEYSATAQGYPATTAPHHSCKVYPLTHSIYISNALGLDWQTALTWNTGVLADVATFLTTVQSGKMPADNDGCTLG